MSDGTFDLVVQMHSSAYPFGLTNRTISINIHIEKSAAIQCSGCGEHMEIVYYRSPKVGDQERIRLGTKCKCGANVNAERVIHAYQGHYDG